jgi:hypothetical protein
MTNAISNHLSLYPNPVRQSLMIESPTKNAHIHISLYDATGRKTMYREFHNQDSIQIDLQKLAAGIYMLHYESDAHIEIIKIEKE